MNTRIVIPARAGSKGFPGKNRILFKYNIANIPEWKRKDVIVSTNDAEVTKQAKEYELTCYNRPEELCEDETSMKQVLQDMAKHFKWNSNDLILTLYLTYPERSWIDVREALHFFTEQNAKSLLCKKKWNGTHPALCMWTKENAKGEQLFTHNLYRRQDYPEVFEITHYISIIRVDELDNLNLNLYNKETVFFPVYFSALIDVDEEADFLGYLRKNK